MTHEREWLRPWTPGAQTFFRLFDALLIFFSPPLFIYVSGRGYALLEWYYLLGAVSVILFLFSAEVVGLYRYPILTRISEGHGTIARAWGFTCTLILVLGYATKISAVYSRLFVFLWFGLVPAAMGAWRVALRWALGKVRARGTNVRTVAVLGTGETARRIAETVRQSPFLGLRFVGLYGDRTVVPDAAGGAADPPEVTGSTQDLVLAAKRGAVDQVYLALPLSEAETIERVISEFADSAAEVFFVPDLQISGLLRARWMNLGDLFMISVYDSPLNGPDAWVKRAEDIVLGALALAIAAVPMLGIAALIRVKYGAPVLFRQRRYGVDGKPIAVWKFRTMTVCEDGEHVPQARENDSRITALGRFLRRTSLDELPQLINVLQGRMSLVGPRPHAIAHNEAYRKQVRGYMLRHRVRPGLTGLAQVRGWRGETDTLEKMSRRVECDLEYIRNWSLALDARILWETLFGRKAHRNAR